jgi:hypothetical protein
MTEITFARLPSVSPEELVAHMSDLRMAAHMPLLSFKWDRNRVDAFVAAKEAQWMRDGLGHWAFLTNDVYAGWGGLQKEGDEWDFGLVLKPNRFGLGPRIAKQVLDFARADDRIPFVTFLLPPTRKKLGALERLGAQYVGGVVYERARFMKYRLDTGKTSTGPQAPRSCSSRYSRHIASQ